MRCSADICAQARLNPDSAQASSALNVAVELRASFRQLICTVVDFGPDSYVCKCSRVVSFGVKIDTGTQATS